MTERQPTPVEADLIGKTVRIVEADWSKNVGIVGKATWHTRPYEDDTTAGLGGVDHHWTVYPDVSSPQWTGKGYYGKRVELVEAQPFSAAEAAAKVFKGKLCRITEAPWAHSIGQVGYAHWEPEGFPGRPDIRWVLSRTPGGASNGYWAKNIELVADDATVIKEAIVEDAVEGAPRTPLEQRAWALKWAKDAYPDGTDIDHMGVADWLLKAEETITYPIYHPAPSEGTKDPDSFPATAEWTDAQGRHCYVESRDGADKDDEVAHITVEGSSGYLTALRAKRVIEVLQRAINRA